MTFNPDYLSQTPLPESLSSNILPELQGVPGGGEERRKQSWDLVQISGKSRMLYLPIYVTLRDEYYVTGNKPLLVQEKRQFL